MPPINSIPADFNAQAVPPHGHTGVDSPQLDPADFLGFPIFDSVPTHAALEGTIVLYRSAAAEPAEYRIYLRINKTWQSIGIVGAGGLNALKQPARVATTANITLSGTQTIDGVAVVAGDRVLVKNQTTGSANGIYVVAAGVWSRATDADTSAEVKAGMVVAVNEGTVNADTIWFLSTNDTITLGTTALTFLRFDPALLTTKGDLLGHNGTQQVRVAVGSNGQVPTADNGQAPGWSWQTPSAVAVNNAIKEQCRLATLGNHSLSGLSSIDGVTPVAGDRILVKEQTIASANGIYVAASGAWSRATDFDLSSEIKSGVLISVNEGQTNYDIIWYLSTSDPITLGTTDLYFRRMESELYCEWSTLFEAEGRFRTRNVDGGQVTIPTTRGGELKTTTSALESHNDEATIFLDIATNQDEILTRNSVFSCHVFLPQPEDVPLLNLAERTGFFCGIGNLTVDHIPLGSAAFNYDDSFFIGMGFDTNQLVEGEPHVFSLSARVGDNAPPNPEFTSLSIFSEQPIAANGEDLEFIFKFISPKRVDFFYRRNGGILNGPFVITTHIPNSIDSSMQFSLIGDPLEIKIFNASYKRFQ